METNQLYLYLGVGFLVVLLLIFMFKNNVVSVLTKGKWVIKSQDDDQNYIKNKGKKNRFEQGEGKNDIDNDGNENIFIQNKRR